VKIIKIIVGKIMQKKLLKITIFSLFFLNPLFAENKIYFLRKIDSNVTENNKNFRKYIKKIKNEVAINETNEISSDYKPKKKSGKYEGIYKIGNPYEISGTKYYPKEVLKHEETGIASWYGADFHNKKTSNGETYNMNDFTAAHRTLPMPSVVLVTNLENGKSIKVRVNDRGPFVKNRIIDVSKKVAAHLDFQNTGTTKVKIKFLKTETDEMLKEYGLKI
jgi:rare lipoprotein A (peptidoglycan hydrolase)